MKNGLLLIDDILKNSSLQQKPRAFLLLKLCQLANVIRPDKAIEYWEKLRKESFHLPFDQGAAYSELEEVMGPDKKEEKKGFNAEILKEVKWLNKKKETNPEETVKGFQSCEERIRKKLWPFGKKTAWNSLISAWADISREDALRLIKKTSTITQKDIIRKLDKKKPLTPEEWDHIYKSIGGKTVTTVMDFLDDQSDLSLNLSSLLAKSVASNINADIIFDKEMKPDAEPEKAYDKFERMVIKINEHNPCLADELLDDLYYQIAHSHHFDTDFEERFVFLKRAIQIWFQIKKSNDEVFAYISEKTPKYLLGFTLSFWLSLITQKEKDAVENLKKLFQSTSDFKSAEEYFLKTLVLKNQEELAWGLVDKSDNKDDLYPKLRAAVVSSQSKTAQKIFKLDDFKDDPIGQFFFLKTLDEKINFLRKHTDNGARNLPDALWKKPTVDDVIAKDSNTLYKFYMKTTEEEEQFKTYLQLFMTYDHNNVDLLLLYTLTKWAEKHPNEVKSLLKNMWEIIKPTDTDLQADILRNAIFERCRIVFAADLEILAEFIKWVKENLVDRIYQYQLGQTSYSLSLKEETLFLFCLISAEKVRDISRPLADEILRYALQNYKGEKKQVKFAAGLYAEEKGIYGIVPPVELNKKILDSWQVGIIEASIPILAEALIKKENAIGTETENSSTP